MKKNSTWILVKEAVQALGGAAYIAEIIKFITKKYPGTDPRMIRGAIVTCTVNHKSRVHYLAKGTGIADKPYDFLFQPKSGIGYVEWYDPERHGVWGNEVLADGKPHVTLLEREKEPSRASPGLATSH